jgi:hypothetical protein
MALLEVQGSNRDAACDKQFVRNRLFYIMNVTLVIEKQLSSFCGEDNPVHTLQKYRISLVSKNSTSGEDSYS